MAHGNAWLVRLGPDPDPRTPGLFSPGMFWLQLQPWEHCVWSRSSVVCSCWMDLPQLVPSRYLKFLAVAFARVII